MRLAVARCMGAVNANARTCNGACKIARAMISALHVSLFAGLKRALPSLQPGTFRQALRWAGRALRHSSIDTIASIRCGVPLI
jgi:hypothetical protein